MLCLNSSLELDLNLVPIGFSRYKFWMIATGPLSAEGGQAHPQHLVYSYIPDASYSPLLSTGQGRTTATVFPHPSQLKKPNGPLSTSQLVCPSPPISPHFSLFVPYFHSSFPLSRVFYFSLLFTSLIPPHHIICLCPIPSSIHSFTPSFHHHPNAILFLLSSPPLPSSLPLLPFNKQRLFTRSKHSHSHSQPRKSNK